ncbi:BRO-N domain-containing protein [Blastomonas sp.]|uniref:BRO-N domain-containing protein n=1 Tax=Blastomonas sp. TaxID=1909299 RepID=UPI00406A1A51
MLIRDGEPWWVGDDVARTLELANRRQAVGRLEDYEKGVCIVDTLGGPQSVTIINESGFYSLLLTSRKPVAKAMKRWLTTQVLPSIRKHGCYPPPPPPAALLEDNARAIPDHEKTIAQRFRKERLRIEASTGHQLANIPSMSKQIIAAIENDMGGVTKGQRIRYLALAGVDVLYVLTGRRTIPRPAV